MTKDYNSLTPEEKKIVLFMRQKQTMDLFLERNAISKDQYDISLWEHIDKMRIDRNDIGGDSIDDKETELDNKTFTKEILTNVVFFFLAEAGKMGEPGGILYNKHCTVVTPFYQLTSI